VKQGEIWYADLSPVVGREQSGRRPVVITSGNMLNQNLPVVIVMPLTTKIKNYKGNPVLEPSKENGLKQQSEVLVFHVRSVSQDRLVKRVGQVTKAEVNLALKTLNDIMTY